MEIQTTGKHEKLFSFPYLSLIFSDTEQVIFDQEMRVTSRG